MKLRLIYYVYCEKGTTAVVVSHYYIRNDNGEVISNKNKKQFQARNYIHEQYNCRVLTSFVRTKYVV